jgi:hypothetical protein
MRVTCIVCYPFWRWSRDRPAEFADVGWRAWAADLAGGRSDRHALRFRSARRTRAVGDWRKILTWDRDGYVLWYKRLEQGVFKLPRMAPGRRSIELRASELAMLLDGIDMARLKRIPRYERPPKNRVKMQENMVA